MTLFSSLRRMTMRARLTATSLTILTLALFGGGLAFYSVARNVVMGSISEHLEVRAVEVLSSCHRYLRERLQTVELWSEADELQTTLDSGDPKFAEDYLRRTVQDRPAAYALLLLTDPTGKVLAAVRPAQAGATLAEVVPKALGLQVLGLGDRSQLSLVQRDDWVKFARPDEATSLWAGTPILDFSGDLVGTLQAIVSRKGVEQFLLEAARGDRSSAYIPVLQAMGTDVLFTVPGENPAPFVEALSRRMTTDGVARLEVKGSINTAYLNVVAVMAASSTPRWSVSFFTPEAAAVGPLNRLTQILIGSVALLLLLAAGISVIALRRASQPLTELNASMARVAQGDLTIRLPRLEARDLGRLVESFNTMVEEVDRSRADMARTEAMRREMEIARQIQLSILPKNLPLEGFEIAAKSSPASQVGGDFYDVVPSAKSFWLVIGDVSGHGLNAGLVMLMVQAAAHTTIAAHPDISPSELIADVNRTLYENIRRRMGGDDYVTMMVARHVGQGQFLAAGSHQPVFVARTSGEVHTVNGAGPWCGLIEEIGPMVTEFTFEVGEADTMLLITDGIVEARASDGEQFGEERLAKSIKGDGSKRPEQTLSHIFSTVENFMKTQEDDMTAVVLRRKRISDA